MSFGEHGYVKTANIATAKSQLSRLLSRVKKGEAVVITDRHKPVARLEPIRELDAVIARLCATGQLVPPKAEGKDVENLLSLPSPRLPKGKTLTEAVLAEREETP